MPETWISAWWGIGGAFIYAAPRWVACMVASRKTGGGVTLCTVEGVVAIIVGAIAAAAFSGLASGVLNMKDATAVSAMVGLVANRIDLAAVLGGRLLKSLKGDEK